MAGRCGADPPPGSGPKLETLRSDEGSRIGETSLYAVPAVRASRLERPDGAVLELAAERVGSRDRKSTRLNSSHSQNSYAVLCLKKKKNSVPRASGHTHATHHHDRPHHA